MKNSPKKLNRHDRGIATLEILIAMVIIVMAISGAIMLVFNSQSSAVGSETNQEALYKAQQQIENARTKARADFNDPSLTNSTTYDTNGITYTKNLTFTKIDDFTKEITSNIIWGGNTQVQLTTRVSDWFSASGMCNPTLSNPDGWKTPQIYPPGSPPGFPTTELVKQSPLGSNGNGLGIADLKVYGRKLYLAANVPAGSDTHTFYIASLPTDLNGNPQFLGWASTIGKSLNAVTVAPHGSKLYAYVANAYSPNYSTCLTSGTPDSNKCAQLQIIDVTPDVSGGVSPNVIKNILIPAYTSAATPKLASGKSIFYYKGYIYLGLTISSGSGSEFNIFDVGGGTGSPTNPIPLGTYQVGRTINSINIKDNYAYLATTDNTNELIVLNISPSPVGSFDPTLNDAAGNNSGLGNSIYMTSSRLFLGRTYSLSSNDPEFYIINPTNPISYPSSGTGSIDIGTNANPDSVNGIIVRSNLVFLLTNKQFQVWNLSDLKPWTPNKITSEFIPLSILGVSGDGQASNCVGNYIYIGAQSNVVGGNHKDVIATLGPSIPLDYNISNDTGGTKTIAKNSTGSIDVTSTLVSGNSTAVTLNVSGLPPHTSVQSITPASCNPTCTSTIVIKVNNPTISGIYPITITGTPTGVTTVPTTFNLVVP